MSGAAIAADAWSVPVAVATLAACGVVLIAAGVRFTRVVDRLADRLGIGEALAGAVLLGATTSLPGLIVTTRTAALGLVDLAVSNALGGIAAQTMFLAWADLSYRHANLEHAAASVPNLLQTMILVAMLSLVLCAAAGPPLTLWGVHPVSLVLPGTFVAGLALAKRSRDAPMWHPLRTPQTRPDVPDPDAVRESLPRLLLVFVALAMVVGACGFAVATAGTSLVARTELSGTLVGGLFTAVITSLPELVTVLAAVRVGALTLAVGDIVGGNAFDVLFLSAADVAHRSAPIYASIGQRTIFLLALTLLLTGVFAAGLVYRQRSGIGFEGLAILAVYGLGFAVLASMG